MDSSLRAATLAATLSAAAITTAHAGSVRIDSQWIAAPLEIDGSLTDWSDGLMYEIADKAVFGVFNDDQHLYLFVKSWDLTLNRQIMAQGMTLRLEPDGRDRDAIALRAPLGLIAAGELPSEPAAERAVAV